MSDQKRRIVVGLLVVVAVVFVFQEAFAGEDFARLAVPCPLSDEGEGEGEGEPANGATSPAVRTLRHVLPLSAAVLVVLMAVPAARRRIGDRRLTVMLAACAAVAVGSFAFLDRSPEDRLVNGWEFFHYYLGAKYSPELGYTGLYDAALVADFETGREFRHERDAIRNLEDGTCIAVEDVLRDAETIKSRFSPARWESFTGDIRYFKSVLSPSRWNGVFRDKGYNPSPVWTMIAAPLASRVPTSSAMGMFGLSMLDPLLLILAVFAVWRTFGARPALLMVILIGTHMTTSHTHMKGAFLRTDWVTALVLAVCAVKSRRPVVGGALVAFSAALRVFPGLFALGLLIAAVQRGPRQREAFRFGAGFAITLALLVAMSALVLVPGTWPGFVDKIWQHHDSFSPWRVGFKHLFLGAYEYLPDGATHQQVFGERAILWWGIQGLMLAGLATLVRRLKSWETLALGFVPMFFLVSPTYYYYIVLVIPLLFFSGRMPRPECTLGIGWLFASSSIAYVLQDVVGLELPLFYVLSLIVFSICALMSFSAWRPLQRRSPVEDQIHLGRAVFVVRPDDVHQSPVRKRLGGNQPRPYGPGFQAHRGSDA